MTMATTAVEATSGIRRRRILIVVKNLPVPFNRRVWAEAQSLRPAGYEVSVICPRGLFAEASFKLIDGIEIHRHPLPIQAKGKLAYPAEYSSALLWEFAYSLKVFMGRGFEAIHACNPPDLIFLIQAFYKYLFGKKFVFDHHDLNPEPFGAKFGHRGLIWKVLVFLERMTFRAADFSIATNLPYARVAVQRGKMTSDRVYVVRSEPNPTRVREAPEAGVLRNMRRHIHRARGTRGHDTPRGPSSCFAGDFFQKAGSVFR
jgi:hypothetical protein